MIGGQVEELAIAKLVCEYCGSAPGQVCVTRSRRSAPYVHSVRWGSAREEFFVHVPGQGWQPRIEAVS